MKHVKAQSEIMGLTIIMILIAMGILFGIVFFTGSSEKGFTLVAEQELVSNTLNAMIQTATNCEGQTIEKLISDCEGEQRFLCGSVDSCRYVKAQIESILADILETQNREYYFQIKDSQNLRNLKSGKCSGEQTSSTSYIVYYGGTLTAKLDLCR
jgi:hypothetical protein